VALVPFVRQLCTCVIAGPPAVDDQVFPAVSSQPAHAEQLADDEVIVQEVNLTGKALPLQPSSSSTGNMPRGTPLHAPVAADRGGPGMMKPLAVGAGLTSPLRRLLDTEDSEDQALQAARVCHSVCPPD
jgi:hypothetical protein